MKIKKMLEERNGLVEEAKSLVEVADKEDRDFSEDETLKYDGLKNSISLRKL